MGYQCAVFATSGETRSAWRNTVAPAAWNIIARMAVYDARGPVGFAISIGSTSRAGLDSKAARLVECCMRIHYNGDFLSDAEVRDALALLTNEVNTPQPIEVTSFDDPMDDRLGFLLPAERGGDDAPFFYESLKLILAFGSASAFGIFAKGFLGRAGELVAERLLKPASQEYRDAALERERSKRSEWEDHVQFELEAMREMDQAEPTAEQVAHVRARWRAWGEEPTEHLEYRGSLDVTVYIEEEKRVMTFQLKFDPRRQRLLSEAPFRVSAAHRYWEQAGIEFMLMLEELERGPDPGAEDFVERERADRQALRRVFQEIRERERHSERE